MTTAPAEIACTCGHRFVVVDDGNGAPHPCPSCRVANVLPRVSGVAVAAGPAPGATVARATAVLSNVQLLHASGRDLPEGTMLGPYRIARAIGRGGMGSVYEAYDERGGARVALKVLSPDLARKPDFVARFHRESRALSGIADPRIAQVYFSGAAEGLPFFAMEYVDGRNLEQVMQEEGTFAPQRAIDLMKEAALGLAAAAERGIIHRDVKPTNLLLDRVGNLRIVDFGLAKALDSESHLTVTGAVVGTPYYLSPEQGLGKPVDERSDVYSLGATFYHLLTGAPPFEAESPVSIILKHVNDAPPPLRERARHVPEPLQRVIMRCLAKDPRKRYQDHEELIDDLDAARAGEPVAAPPVHELFRGAGPSVVVMDELEEGARVLRRASRPRRALALAFDLFAGVLAWSLGEALVADAFEPALALFPVVWSYIALGDVLGGGTLGKRILGLRVARPDGGVIGPLGGALRALLLVPTAALVPAFLPGPFGRVIADVGRALGLDPSPSLAARIGLALLIAFAIDVLATLVTRRRETLHDRWSRTGVFKEERVRKKKRRRGMRPGGAAERREGAVLPPFLVLVLSICAPGLGQLANGQGGKALAFFAGTCLLLANDARVGLVLWLFASWEAWRTVRRRAAT